MAVIEKTLLAVGPGILNIEGPSIVGGDSALNDSSTSTYLECNADGSEAVEASWGIEPNFAPDEVALGLPVLHIRVSMTGGDDGSYGSLYLYLQNGSPEDISGDLYIAKFTNGGWFGISNDLPLPLDGTIHDLALPMKIKPGVVESAIWECLNQGPFLMINYIENRGWQTEPVVARVYEAYLTYDVEVTDPVSPPVGQAEPTRVRFS